MIMFFVILNHITPLFAVNIDVQTAKEMIVLAGSSQEQKAWVQRLAKRVAKHGYTHSGSIDKGTPG